MTFPGAGLIRAIFAFVLVVLLGSQLALSDFAWHLFGRKLLPEMNLKAATIGESIRGKLLSAIALGVPFDRLEGVEEFFRDCRDGNDDLAFLALGSPGGDISHVVGIDRATAQRLATPTTAWRPERHVTRDKGIDYAVTTFPLVRDGRRLGMLYVAVAQSYIGARMSEIGLDILTVVAISLLVAFEALQFILSAKLEQPLRDLWATLGNVAQGNFCRICGTGSPEIRPLAGRVNELVLEVGRRAATLKATVDRPGRPEGAAADEALNRLERRFRLAWDGQPQEVRHSPVLQVRILTILFVFAEQLSRPFLPLLARDLLPAWAGPTRDLMAGIPIAAFMLVAALGMPVAARWTEKVGPQRAFSVGAVALTAGSVGSAFALSIYDFVLWRMVSAAGYAVMFMACREFALDNAGANAPARSVSTFIGAIVVSEVCAPAIGGILADRVGYSAVFLLGAVMAVATALLGRAILAGRPAADEGQADGILRMAIGMRNLRFAILMAFAAIPAKMMYAGFLVYLLPVLMAHLGATQAETGRVLLTYGLVGLLLTPLVSAAADRLKWHGVLVGVGGMVAGAGLLPILFQPDRGTVLLGVAALGVGQTISMAPQLALATQVCQDEIASHGHKAVVSLYQFLECCGATLGALAGAALTAAYGPLEAMALLGAGCFICSVVFSASFLVLGVQPDEKWSEIAGDIRP